jgi:hypothetical protein
MDIEQKIQALQQDLTALTDEFYANNFSARQDFYKFSDFKTRLKVPHYDSTPAIAEVGELCEVGGILYIASAANTWVVCGTQS